MKRLDLMDRQVESIEQASDDVQFTQVLKHSNQVIKELHDQIDYDEIRVA